MLITDCYSCKPQAKNGSAYTTRGLFRSSQVIDCMVGGVPGGAFRVTAANYGSDYYDAASHPATHAHSFDEPSSLIDSSSSLINWSVSLIS